MEVSRLTISSDMLKQKRLSNQKKNKLAWARLREQAEEDGFLRASDRCELGFLAGYPRGQERPAYQWAARQIKKGNILELIDKVENGLIKYRYYLRKEQPNQMKGMQVFENAVGSVTRKDTEDEKTEIAIDVDGVVVKMETTLENAVQLVERLVKERRQ